MTNGVLVDYLFTIDHAFVFHCSDVYLLNFHIDMARISTYPLFDYYPKRMYLKEYRQYSCFVLRLLSKRLEILQC